MTKITHFCHNIIFLKDEILKKFSVRPTERNFLSEESTSCLRKKFPMTRRNLLSQKEIYCLRDKIPVTGRNYPLTGQNLKSQNEIPYPIRGRNFLLQEDISLYRTKFPVTRRNFLAKEISS